MRIWLVWYIAEISVLQWQDPGKLGWDFPICNPVYQFSLANRTSQTFVSGQTCSPVNCHFTFYMTSRGIQDYIVCFWKNLCLSTNYCKGWMESLKLCSTWLKQHEQMSFNKVKWCWIAVVNLMARALKLHIQYSIFSNDDARLRQQHVHKGENAVAMQMWHEILKMLWRVAILAFHVTLSLPNLTLTIERLFSMQKGHVIQLHISLNGEKQIKTDE